MMDWYASKIERMIANGTVKKVLHTASILYIGWEMDNEGWIVEMPDGTIAAFTTNHGGWCCWDREEVEEAIARAEDSITSLRKALTMWPDEGSK